MIRRLKPGDVSSIEAILKKTENFKEAEVNVAMELVQIVASDPQQEDYNIFVYEDNEKILGYHCTGRRPLTDAVYDLYWIVTDTENKNKGIGKSLIAHAENFVKENNGRWLLVETSSRDIYQATRNFYLRNGYSIISEINDFYSLGDNLIVFGKYFNNKKI